MRWAPFLIVLVTCGCGRTALGPLGEHINETPGDDGDPFDGDSDQPTGPQVDWRIMAPEQWPLVKAELDAAAAQGTNGTTTAIERCTTFAWPVSHGFNGAVLGANGRIYGIPDTALQVLEIDPSTNPVTCRYVGPMLPATTDKWNGGVLAANGVVYAAPYSSSDVLRIDTNTNEPVVDTVPLPGSLPSDTGKWSGPVRAYDGKIYAPCEAATTILVIDPTTEPETISDLANGGGEHGYGGAAIAPSTGKIYLIPYSAAHVLELDPATGQTRTVGPDYTSLGGSKWYGAVLDRNEIIWGIAEGATSALRIDTKQNPPEISLQPLVAFGSDGGAISVDGRVFATPWTADGPIEYINNTTVPITPAYAGASPKWDSGILAPNGRIYTVPSDAQSVLEIDPKSVGTLSLDVLLGGFLNTY